MNGQMIELARLAGLKKHPSEDHEYIGDFDWREFGELIVKRCITAVENTGYGYRDYRAQIEEGMRNACVESIKHEFGVEP